MTIAHLSKPSPMRNAKQQSLVETGNPMVSEISDHTHGLTHFRK